MSWQAIGNLTALLGATALFGWACVRFSGFRYLLWPLWLAVILLLVLAGAEFSTSTSSSWFEAKSRMLGNILLLAGFAFLSTSMVAFTIYLLQ